MTQADEIFNALYALLEWHDTHSCLCDIEGYLKLRRKYAPNTPIPTYLGEDSLVAHLPEYAHNNNYASDTKALPVKSGDK